MLLNKSCPNFSYKEYRKGRPRRAFCGATNKFISINNGCYNPCLHMYKKENDKDENIN